MCSLTPLTPWLHVCPPSIIISEWFSRSYNIDDCRVSINNNMSDYTPMSAHRDLATISEISVSNYMPDSGAHASV